MAKKRARSLDQKVDLSPDKPLTRRQQLFVKHFVASDGMITQREAAVKAGYPPSSASTRAGELLNPRFFPNVVQEIDRYRLEIDRVFEVGYKRHVRDLQRIRDAALSATPPNFSAAVMAEKARGLAQGGIYVNKSEVRHGTIDSMSRTQVEEELNAIRERFERFDEPTDITPRRSDEKPDSTDRDPARVRALEGPSVRVVENEEVDSDDPA